MRHRSKINQLSRTASHRKALMKNMSMALITNKRINTTLAKAKSLRSYLEPLVTKAKKNTMHSRRVVFGYLQDKESVKELFGPIAEKIGDRPGGYLRIIKTGFRLGDAAEMAMIEFVDFNDSMISASKASGSAKDGKKRTRRGRKRGKGSEAVAAAPAASSEEE